MSKPVTPDYTPEETALLDAANMLVDIAMDPSVTVEVFEKIMDEVKVINVTVYGERYRRILAAHAKTPFYKKLFRK